MDVVTIILAIMVLVLNTVGSYNVGYKDGKSVKRKPEVGKFYWVSHDKKNCYFGRLIGIGLSGGQSIYKVEYGDEVHLFTCSCHLHTSKIGLITQLVKKVKCENSSAVNNDKQ